MRHTHFVVKETPAPIAVSPDRVEREFICGETTSWRGGSTNLPDRVTCPKCSAKVGAIELTKLAEAGHKIELVKVDKDDIRGYYRSQYRMLINGVEYLDISAEYGWGKPWRAEHVDTNYYPVHSKGTRFERVEDYFQSGLSKEMVAANAARRIIAEGIPGREEAERRIEVRNAEHRARMEAADAREAQEKAETRARLQRALAGVEAALNGDPAAYDDPGLADAKNILAGLLQGNQYEI